MHLRDAVLKTRVVTAFRVRRAMESGHSDQEEAVGGLWCPGLRRAGELGEDW